MIVARVTGEVVATIKHGDLAAQKLLLVQPVTADGKAAGKAAIAVDAVDAGPGDLVLVVDEGNSAAQVLRRPRGAVRTVVVGVIDAWEIGGTPMRTASTPGASEGHGGEGERGGGREAERGAPRRRRRESER